MLSERYSATGAIKRLGNRVNDSVLTSLYYSLINCHIIYLAPVYGTSANEHDLNRLQVAQNNAIRTIFAFDYLTQNMNTNEIYRKYKILNIKQIINYNLAILIFKIERRQIKLDYNIQRNSHIHSYATRNTHYLTYDTSRTETGHKSILSSGALLYNSLGREIKQIPTLAKFKKELNNHFLAETTL